MKRRFLCMLLCLAMLFGTVPTGAENEALYDEQDSPGGVAVLSADTALSDGEQHSHTFNENGECECGYKCLHENVTADEDNGATCDDCGAVLVVKIENGDAAAYGTDINSAIENAEDGSRLTVVSHERSLNLNLNLYVPDNVTFTLDLNGHSLTSRDLHIGRSADSNSRLIINDTRGGGQIGLEVRNGGALEFRPKNASTLITTLGVYGGDVKLHGGNITLNQWTFDDAGTINLTHLLPEGYAYAQYQFGQVRSWLKREELNVKNYRSSFNLAVLPCTQPAEADGCEYCGAETLVKITKGGADTYYTRLDQATIDAANGGTVTLLKNIDGKNRINKQIEVSNNTFTLELNDYALLGEINGKEPIFYLGENANVTVKDSGTNGFGRIVWNPSFKIDGGSLTIESGTINSMNSLDKVIEAVSGSLIIKGGDLNRYVIVRDDRNNNGGVPRVNTVISGGSFERLLVKGATHAQLLADGYAFAKKSDNSIVDGYQFAGTTSMEMLDEVKVVPHTEHSYDSSGKCACGVSCRHANVDGSGKCADCGKQAAANVQNDATSEIKYFFDIKDAFASVKAGESKTLNNLLLDDYTSDENIVIEGSILYNGLYGKQFNFAPGKSAIVKNGGWLGIYGGFGAVTLEDGSRFGMQGDGEATLGLLTVNEGSRIFTDGKIQNGIFGEIVINAKDKTLDDMLLKSEGRHRTFIHTDDSTWATDDELGGKNIKNVRIAYKPFYDEKLTAAPIAAEYSESGAEVTLTAEKTDGEEYSGATTYKWYKLTESGDAELTKAPDDTAPDNAITVRLSTIGEHRFKCIITREGYTRTVEVQTSVNKATPTYTKDPKAKADLVYNQGYQKLIEEGTVSGGTIMYSLDGTDWSEEAPQAMDAGDYTVHYKVVGNDNYNGIDGGTLPVSIAAFKLSGVSIGNIEKKYDGTTNPPFPIVVNGFISDADGTLIDMRNYSMQGSYETAAAGEKNKKFTLRIMLDNGNYVFSDGSSEKVFTYTDATIKKIDALPPADGELSVIYNLGRTYTFETAELLADPIVGYEYGKLTYEIADIDLSTYYSDGAAIDEESGKLTLPILKSNSGSGEIGWVKIKVISENFNDIELTVNVRVIYKTVPHGNPILSSNELKIGDELGKITLSGSLSDDDGNTVEGTFTWNDPTAKPAKAGEIYKAEWTFTPSDSFYMYDKTWGKADITVLKADSACNAPAANALAYNGDEQELITKGSTSDGTMLYKIGSADWSESVPKAMNAGEYYVYYKVKGDSNHNDSAEQSIKVTIAKAQNAIENLSVTGWTYGEAANSPSADAKFGTIEYSYSTEKDGTYTSKIPQDAGTYWVKAAVEGTENYTYAESEPLQLVIAKLNIAGAVVGDFNLTYNGSAQKPTATVTTIDGRTVTGEWTNVTNVDDKATFTAEGNFEGTLADVATGMARKSVENAVIALDGVLTYNGTVQTQKVTVTLDGFTAVTYDVSGNAEENAGEYKLTVTGTGNFGGQKLAEWSISKATPAENSEKPTTARMRRGGALENASVTEGEVLDINNAPLRGSFAWKEPKKTSVGNTEKMIFTPDSTNYAPIELDVPVSVYSSGSGGGSASISYTVAFETNGAGRLSSVRVSKNGTVKEPAEPSKDGYRFGGWYTDKELKNEYDFSAKVTKSFTLYAAWIENEEKTETEPSDKPSDPDKTNPFDDVSKDDWYYDDVVSAAESGLFGGTGDKTFAPNTLITRGMFVTVLYRAEGSPEVNAEISFADVSADSYYADAVVWAEQNEIVNGVTETEFAPNENITREQLAAILYRYANYKDYDTSQGGMRIREFDDCGSISDYAAAAMTWTVNAGLMKGRTETELKPRDNATRAEVAAILNRFIASYK